MSIDPEDALADLVRKIVTPVAPRDEFTYDDIYPDFWKEGE